MLMNVTMMKGSPQPQPLQIISAAALNNVEQFQLIEWTHCNQVSTLCNGHLAR